MQIILMLLAIYLIFAVGLFLSFIISKQNVKFTNYTTNEVSYLEGVKKIGCFALMALLWPYILIRNIIKGE